MMIVFPWQIGYDVSPDDEYDHDGDGYVECEIMIDINTWASQQPALMKGESNIRYYRWR